MTETTIARAELFLRAAEALAEGIRANKPLPPSKPLTADDIRALVAKAQAELPAAVAFVRAHAGFVSGTIAALAVLQRGGEAWAGPVAEAVAAIPAGLAEGETALPEIAWLVKMFAPAPSQRAQRFPGEV